MLQQTQVATVIPYFGRWMSRFPNVGDLAAASEPALLKAWEGLGYYSRVRNLQKAARAILRDFGGVFPSEYEQVLGLPGIGPYTAGAICSIAFDQPTPILDGNVARVLARIFTVPGEIKSSATRSKLWQLSTDLVQSCPRSKEKHSHSSPSALNQALMELGALICTPRNPRCDQCPVASACTARLRNQVSRYPESATRKPLRRRLFFAFVLQKDDQILIRRRENQTINQGFWEFPNVEISSGKKHASQVEDFLGISPPVLKPWKTIRHTITSNAITLRVFRVQLNGEADTVAQRLQSEWHPPSDLDPLPFTSAHSKIRASLATARK